MLIFTSRECVRHFVFFMFYMDSHISTCFPIDVTLTELVRQRDRSHSKTCVVLYFGLSDEFQSIFADFADVLGSHFDTLELLGKEGWSACKVTHKWSRALASPPEMFSAVKNVSPVNRISCQIMVNDHMFHVK